MLWVRFPNESNHHEMEIDIDQFERRDEFNDEVFGLYKGNFICIKK